MHINKRVYLGCIRAQVVKKIMEQGQDLRLLTLNPVKPISNTALNKGGPRTRPCRINCDWKWAIVTPFSLYFALQDPLEMFTNTLQADGRTIYTTDCKVGPVHFMLTNGFFATKWVQWHLVCNFRML